MEVYKYDSYEEYVKVQTAANIKKLNYCWAQQSTMTKISKLYPEAKDILCHGTRNGSEIKFFKHAYKDMFGANIIIGTEISETATQFPDTYQHDFHEVKDEWVGKFDIIYSNSFDHSYDPVKALDTWTKQLKPTGVLVVELMRGVNNVSSEMDPLSLSIPEYKELVREYGHLPIREFEIGLGTFKAGVVIMTRVPSQDDPIVEKSHV